MHCSLWQTLGALFGYRIGWMLFVASYRCAYGIRCVSALLFVASYRCALATVCWCIALRGKLPVRVVAAGVSVHCSLWQATGARCGSRCVGALLVVASYRCASWRSVYVALRFVASSRVVRCRQSRHVALRIVAGSCAARMAVFCQCSAIRAVYLRVAVFTFCLVSGPSSPRCFARLRRAAYRRDLSR